MLVHHAVIEALQLLVDGDAGFGQGAHQIHGILVAGLQVAAGVGVGGVGGQTEQSDGLAGGQRQNTVVILHNDGAFLTFPDGQSLGGCGHVSDGRVVADEPALTIRGSDVALGTQNIIQIAAVGFCEAGADGGNHQQNCG